MQGKKTHHWAWDISALTYQWSYSYLGLNNQIDDDLFNYLGKRVVGAVVADCGCGPGVVAGKLLRRGASQVIAVDSNRLMVRKARIQLRRHKVDASRVTCVLASHENGTLERLRRKYLGGNGFDLVLFKRSLYLPRPRAVRLLREATQALNSGGRVVVVHPERSLRRYCFSPPFGIARHTPFHLYNRLISRIAERLGGQEYSLYTRRELLSLLREAAPRQKAVLIETKQRAFNLAAIEKKRLPSTRPHNRSSSGK
jgi:SAM-dependent methyltransferase